MPPEAEPRPSTRLEEIQREVLAFGRLLVTFGGGPAYLLNSAPAYLQGRVTFALVLQSAVMAVVIVVPWFIRGRDLRIQALALIAPLLALSALSLAQWGPTFGSGVMQMGLLSLLLIFYHASLGRFALVCFGVLAMDGMMAWGIVSGWIPAPDLGWMDATKVGNWSRMLVTSAVTIPGASFILVQIIRGLLDSAQESERRLVQIQEAQRENDEAQEALNRAQRMDLVGRLAAGLSHDFNNILTVVQGSAQLLETELDDPDDRELVRDIIQATGNAADLSRRLLIFSREGEETEVRPVDLGEMLERVARSLRRLLPSNVDLRINANVTRPVRARPPQLEQALLNLALNSRDAMPDGGWIEIFAGDVLLEGGAPGLLLRVRDSGVGMEAQILARVQEPFFTTKPEGKGTGLGLTMVRKMVEIHGGEMSLHSRPGEGTTVELRLPAWEGETLPEGPEGLRPSHTGSILIVDDDPAVLRTLTRVLQDSGNRVVALGHPREAAHLLDGGEHYDLLITDTVGSVVEPSLVERFLALDKEARVLVYSGYSLEYLKERGLHHGGRVDVALKPLPAAELRQRVSSLLDRAWGPGRPEPPPLFPGA